MLAYTKIKESSVVDSYLLFLALARLADWEGIPVGVIEADTPETKTFTVIINIPEKAIGCVVPRKHMFGYWRQIPLPANVAFFNTPEYTKRIKMIIQAKLVKTIHTTGIK